MYIVYIHALVLVVEARSEEKGVYCICVIVCKFLVKVQWPDGTGKWICGLWEKPGSLFHHAAIATVGE